MLKKIFHNVVNIIWPHLTGSISNYTHQIDLKDIKKSKTNHNTVNNCIKMYEFQKERIKSIESKSMIFIGFFAVAITLLGFILKELLFKSTKSYIDYIYMFLICIIVIYVSNVIRYAIKAIERKGYYSFDEKDFLNIDDTEKVRNIINKIKRNYDVINEKVDFMSLSQDFAKRVISIIIILTFALVIVSLKNIIMNWTIIYDFLTYYKSDIYFLINILFTILIFIILNKRISHLKK